MLLPVPRLASIIYRWLKQLEAEGAKPGTRAKREGVLGKGVRYGGVQFGSDTYRVVRLMRQQGLWTRRRKRFRSTTDSKHCLPIAENLVKRHFRVSQTQPSMVVENYLHHDG